MTTLAPLVVRLRRSSLSMKLVALGAAQEDAKPERIYDAIDSGVLAMDAYVFS